MHVHAGGVGWSRTTTTHVYRSQRGSPFIPQQLLLTVGPVLSHTWYVYYSSMVQILLVTHSPTATTYSECSPPSYMVRILLTSHSPSATTHSGFSPLLYMRAILFSMPYPPSTICASCQHDQFGFESWWKWCLVPKARTLSKHDSLHPGDKWVPKRSECFMWNS